MNDVENRSEKDGSLSLSLWLKENYKLLVSVFLIGVLAYGFSIVNYSFLLDHDSAFIRNGPDFVILHAKIDRWAMWVYYYLLLPGIFYPFIGNILALFFVSLAYCMFITNHSPLSFSQKLLFCAIAVSLPTFGPMFNFSFMVAQVSCSISLVVFAYLLSINGKTVLTRWILPILLCSFATFTYQSLLYIFPGLFLVDCLLNKFNIAEKSTYRVFWRIIGICSVSLICYIGGSNLLHLITGIPQYPAGMFLYSRQPVGEAFFYMLRFISSKFDGTLLSPFLFLPVPAGIILLWGKHRLQYIVLLIIITSYFLFPFIGLGIILPIRSWFFVPFIYAGIFLAAYINSPHKFRIFFSIFSVWLICYNSSINARCELLDNFAAKRDQLVASRIYNEMYDIPQEYLKDMKRSLILGHAQLDNILPKISEGNREYYGASLFSTGRAYNYLAIFGVELPPPLKSPSKLKKMNSHPIVQDMPPYPYKGFIQVVDDVLVIKFAEQ